MRLFDKTNCISSNMIRYGGQWTLDIGDCDGDWDLWSYKSRQLINVMLWIFVVFQYLAKRVKNLDWLSVDWDWCLVLLSVIRTHVKIYRNTSRNIHNGFVIDPSRKTQNAQTLDIFVKGCKIRNIRAVQAGHFLGSKQRNSFVCWLEQLRCESVIYWQLKIV